MSKIDQFLDSDNRKDIAEIAHGIKGSANYCGAVALGNAAENLEKIARDATNDRLPFAIKTLSAAVINFDDYINQNHPEVDGKKNTGEGKNE